MENGGLHAEQKRINDAVLELTLILVSDRNELLLKLEALERIQTELEEKQRGLNQ